MIDEIVGFNSLLLIDLIREYVMPRRGKRFVEKK